MLELTTLWISFTFTPYKVETEHLQQSEAWLAFTIIKAPKQEKEEEEEEAQSFSRNQELELSDILSQRCVRQD